ALTLYEKDLVARGSSRYNAEHPRIHLPGVLLNKPVVLLGATELRKWRDSLLAKGLAPGTVNRTKTGLRAALELAAAHDPRIANQGAWKVGRARLRDAPRARKVMLDDGTVRGIVVAAYDHDRALGLMVEVAAVTGARLSQLARLEVGDLQADGSEPRLLMPLSAKGRTRNKRHERRPVPIADNAPLVRAVETEKTRRVHDGAAAREKAQWLFVQAPTVLGNILNDATTSPRHRIEACRELRAVATSGSESTPATGDRFIIRIDLTAGGGEVLEFNKALAIEPGSNKEAQEGDEPFDKG